MEPPHPTTTTTSTWVLLVDHKFQVIGNIFPVLTTSVDSTFALKVKAKELAPNLFHANPARCHVWMPKGQCIINSAVGSPKHWQKILGSIDIDDEDTIQYIPEGMKVADLRLSDSETLLIQMPDPSLNVASNEDDLDGELLTFQLDQKYEDILPRANTKGYITWEDIDLNKITNSSVLLVVPDFVLHFETLLSRKRRTSDARMYGSAKRLLGDETCQIYFTSSRARRATPGSLADTLELQHLAYISAIDGIKLKEVSNSLFKELDANWLFFNLFARHLRSNNKFVTQFGQEPWPFMLIIRVPEKGYFTYRPKNDFLVLKWGLPRMAVEVNSFLPGKAPLDFYHMMLQGAFIVRFANKFLDAYKEKKNFFFVAIFISGNGEAVRRILFQKMDSPVVFYKERSFNMLQKEACVQFTLELYNIASVLDEEADKDDTAQKIQAFKDIHDTPCKLPTFTGSKRSTKSRESQRSQNQDDHPMGGSGGGMEQLELEVLEANGYKVVPDILETDGGTWELLTKPPPHVRIVYRRGDPNKTEMISKAVREESREPDILNFLRMTGRVSPHVISLIETITSATRKWLILPKMLSIDQRFMDHASVGARSALGWGLIKGLAYLHEHKIAHRDIKPDNLVCDSSCRLQIIDFNVALKVEDENTEIDEYRGTRGWTAPEMGKQDGPTPKYSPIRADRWSCGRVLLRHILVRPAAGVNCVSKIAHQLMGDDPPQRPSLLEWPKWRPPKWRPSDAATVPVRRKADRGTETSRPQQDVVVEVDGESMQPPGAKKPKLEHEQVIRQNCTDNDLSVY